MKEIANVVDSTRRKVDVYPFLNRILRISKTIDVISLILKTFFFYAIWIFKRESCNFWISKKWTIIPSRFNEMK